MPKRNSYEIIVLGAGAAGLVIAIGATRAGKKVLLIDKGTWGGDCTNFGCIPSKTLIAAADAYYGLNKGRSLGILGEVANADLSNVLKHVRDIVHSVREKETPEALEKLGVHVLTGDAKFLDPYSIDVAGKTFKGKQIIIAAGAAARVPDIPGLKNTPFLTNEGIFQLDALPKSLAILGGGPIGVELAQAFCRLGVKVSVIHKHDMLLTKEIPEAQKIVTEKVQKEGVDLFLKSAINSVEYKDKQFTLEIKTPEKTASVTSEQLFVAIGRVPNVDALMLGNANVEYSPKGVVTDDYGRTTQKHIWAVGDVTTGEKFTHLAEHHSRSVLSSLLLPVKKKWASYLNPRVTYTDPEVASFGLSEKSAIKEHGKNKIMTYHVPLSENDRAITASATDGFVNVVTKKLSSRILGATIVCARAGEMIGELLLAANQKIPLRKISQVIHPYPTYNLAIRKASDLWLTKVLLPKIRHPFKSIAFKKVIPITIIVAAMIVAYFLGVQDYFTIDALKQHHESWAKTVSSHPILAPVIFTSIYAISTALSIPGGTILSMIGGFLFSAIWGTCYVLIGATVGASLLFLAARTAFHDTLKKRAGSFIQKIREGFRKNSWNYLLFLRFIPLFPFWLVNILPAFLSISFFTYAWTTFVGIIPGTYMRTLAGSGINTILANDQPLSLHAIFNIKIIIALVALGIFALIPIFLKKFSFKKKIITLLKKRKTSNA